MNDKKTNYSNSRAQHDSSEKVNKQLQEDQTTLAVDVIVPEIQPIQINSNTFSEDESETEPESSVDRSFQPNYYHATKMASDQVQLRKSTRVRKPVTRLVCIAYVFLNTITYDH
ncbi:hypothetical protein BpHYR1_048529 [Brachionus plicatilis]|uniref:Uncharacterized protein n=1 Tax=Brachionus plicatilis TaxID=10195 RepID=A0A3M7Q7H7_BRAPC|nr:hypothetical protein BpHYR1_048529 [Brachionus plicatilis]